MSLFLNISYILQRDAQSFGRIVFIQNGELPKGSSRSRHRTKKGLDVVFLPINGILVQNVVY